MITIPKPTKRQLNRLATHIVKMAKDLCKTPVYKDSVAAQVGGDRIEITNDGGFRAIRVGNPYTGAYAYLYVENETEDGRWLSGYACFPPQREVARRLADLCEGRAENGIRVHTKDSQPKEDLMRHLAAVVAMAAYGM